VTGPAGCANTRKAARLRGSNTIVRHVDFEGNERFRARELRDYLEMRPRKYFPPEKHWFYEGLIPGDVERIVELYHAHGYYEAEVVDVRIDRNDRRRRDAVDLTYVIDEGPVTHVEEVVVRWPEGPPPGPPRKQRGGPFMRSPSLDPDVVSAKVELARGDPFEIPKLNASRTAIRDHLRRAGHPYAEIHERVIVDREAQTAKVELEVIPGPFMRIGSIDIAGLETVPTKPVKVEVEDAIGKPYSPRLVERIEQHAYGMGVFSTVTAHTLPKTRPEGVDVGTIALELDVRERDPQRVRLGGALGFEPQRWDQHVSGRYTHDNLFRNLYKLHVNGKLGYAELPNPFRPVAHGPIANIDVKLEKKGLLEKHLIWTLQPRAELGIEQGYQFWTVEHRFAVSRFFTRWFELELSHNLRYVDFFAVSPSLEAGETLLGLDFRDPYLLSYLGARATIYAVDRISEPNHGAIIGAEYRVAGGPFGGQYDFQEVSPYVRLYWRPFERLQLAARARVGLIYPFGDQPGAPLDLRRYLGGANTVRGWGRRRLAPRLDNCVGDQDYRRNECESIPVGGNTSILASFEVRVRTWKQLWVAGFVDMGDVRLGVAEFVPSELNYTGGGGLRYDSPIGKFRLDVGVRLNDTPLSDGEPIWALHLGLGESF
jgi:outer membrane protein assembly factor BamA